MILSEEGGFVFIKAIKTASTSVEIALSQYCSDADVITELPAPDEAIRRELGYRGPQNNRKTLWQRGLETIRRDAARRARYRFHHNISAAELRRALGAEYWGRLTSFSIVRNPFDRAISKFYHDHRDQQWDRRKSGVDHTPDEISDYIVKLPDADLSNWRFYGEGSEILITRALRYERLDQELAALIEELGLPPAKASLPKAKGNFRLSRQPYASVLNGAARSRIETAAATELERFGYRWSEI